MPINKCHHITLRCRNSRETIDFYKNILELDYVHGLQFKSKDKKKVFHSFLRLEDNSTLSFMEIEDDKNYYNNNSILDQHIALECSKSYVDTVVKRIIKFNKKSKSDIIQFGFQSHGFIESFYFRDPSGNWIELCYNSDPWYFSKKDAFLQLDNWEKNK